MLATKHTQSLTDFRQKAAETLDRLNRTGEAEIITVNGEARAVMLSPTVYDELAKEAQISRDVAVIRQAIQESKEGKGRKASEFFAEVRDELVAMKKARK